MIMLRDAILTATILALIYIAANQPKPVKDMQVSYCEIDQRKASKAFGIYPDGSPALDENGKQRWLWQFSWEKAFGPCSELDRYETI